MAKNATTSLPVWIRYYKKHFVPQDIYVLDHESTDGSTTGLDVQITQVCNPLYNDLQWQVDVTKEWQTKLLKQYEYVLYVDSDEIVIADPTQYPGGLTQYIVETHRDIIRCDGRGLVQDLSTERFNLDWEQPIFKQRRYWYKDSHDCKPLLANRPLNWTWGFHTDTEDPNRPVDQNLLLVHLHRADLKTMLDRHTWMRQQIFCGELGNAGFHHKWSSEEVRKDMQEHQARKEPIPERFDGSIL